MADDNKYGLMIVSIVAIVAIIGLVLYVSGNKQTVVYSAQRNIPSSDNVAADDTAGAAASGGRQILAGTAISSCGVTITGEENTNGQYYLSNDLVANSTNATSSCIFFDLNVSRNITFDCGHYKITDTTPGTGRGISMRSTLAQGKFLTLKNCDVINFVYPLYLYPDYSGERVVVIDGGKFKNTGAGGAILMAGNKELIINKGLFNNVRVVTNTNSELTINGGSFYNYASEGGCAISNWGGTTVINGGEFYNNTCATYSHHIAHTTINGGSFHNNNVAVSCLSLTNDTSYCDISGGEFTNNNYGIIVSDYAIANVVGGTFNNLINDILINGSTAVAILDGGTMCSSGITNIRVQSGTIYGDEIPPKAKCNVVSPSGIYDCDACPIKKPPN